MAVQATHVWGRVYNIGGGGQVSLAQALELIEGYAGRPLAIEHLAGERGDVRDTGADTSRARAELSFEPTVPLEDGLREEFDWALSTTHNRELARV
jgi:UDP-glucuronate 4-epimerase